MGVVLALTTGKGLRPRTSRRCVTWSCIRDRSGDTTARGVCVLLRLFTCRMFEVGTGYCGNFLTESDALLHEGGEFVQ